MKKKKAIILGAGITGLTAGWKLSEKGYDVEILEKSDHIGGLSDNTTKWGLTFDTTPHGFHVHNEMCLKEFIGLMGDELVSDVKHVELKYMGKYVRYPLTPFNMFFSLNFLSAINCGINLLYVKIRNIIHQPEDSSAEDWMINRYGKPLYNIVFKDYTEKIWGLKPSELSPNFSRLKIPNISFLDLFIRVFFSPKKFWGRSHKDAPAIIRFYYPKKGGIIRISERLVEKIKENGGKIHFNVDLKKIELKDNKVQSVLYEDKDKVIKRIGTDCCFSTIPIDSLIELIEDHKDSEVLSSAKRLEYRSLLVVHFLINKNRIFNPQSVYYPTDTIFNRLTDHRSYDRYFEPKDKTVLTVEITCQKDDKIWNMDKKKLLDRVIQDLENENVVKKEEIINSSITKIHHAYPRYDLRYEERMLKVLNRLRQLENLFAGGRQGIFRYLDMDVCFETGLIIADKIENNNFDFKKEKLDIESVILV